MLTQPLVQTAAHVIVIERDRRLARTLRDRFAGAQVICVDAADYRWPRDEPFSVVANLPFEGSGAILARLLADPLIPLERAHVIVQWELAAKLARIWPATLRGTYWRAWHEITIERRFARSAFAPPPSVDTAMLRFERRESPLVAVNAHVAYRRILTTAFASQAPIRHSLRGSLTPLEVKRLATALGFASNAHARDLDAAQWAGVFARAHS